MSNEHCVYDYCCTTKNSSRRKRELDMAGGVSDALGTKYTPCSPDLLYTYRCIRTRNFRSSKRALYYSTIVHFFACYHGEATGYMTVLVTTDISFFEGLFFRSAWA